MKSVQAYLFRGPFNGNPTTSLYVLDDADPIGDAGYMRGDIIFKEEGIKPVSQQIIWVRRIPPQIVEAIKREEPHEMWGVAFGDGCYMGDPLIDCDSLSDLMRLRGTDSMGLNGTIKQHAENAYESGSVSMIIIPGDKAGGEMHEIIEGAVSQFPSAEAVQ
jgi:hypothetical protein